MTSVESPNPTAASPAATTTQRLAIATPGDWIVMPLNPKNRDQRIAQMVEEQLGKHDSAAHLRRQIIVQLRKSAAQAHANGAFFAAMHHRVIEETAVSASVMAMLTPLLKGRDGVVLDSAEGIEAFFASGATGAEILEHSVLELEVGRAARIRKRMGAGIRTDKGEEPQVENVEFFVPLIQAERMFSLVFSTPTLPLADAYAELFDVLASSATWVMDEPEPDAAALDVEEGTGRRPPE